MANVTLAERSQLHIARKLWHIFIGGGAVAIYHMGDHPLKFWGAIAFGIAVFGFALDFTRLRLPKLNETFIRAFSIILRKSERSNFSGLPFYALGVALSIYFYQKEIALLSIYFLVFADPASSFIGIQYGKDKILPHKSLQGTITCFLVCFVITLLTLFESEHETSTLIAFALLAGVFGAISELFSAFNIDDNITIPVVSGAGLSLLNYFFKIY